MGKVFCVGRLHFLPSYSFLKLLDASSTASLQLSLQRCNRSDLVPEATGSFSEHIFLYLSLEFDTIAHSLLCDALSSLAFFGHYILPLWQNPFLLLPPKYWCAALCMHCLRLLLTYSDVLDLELVQNHRLSVPLATSFCLSSQTPESQQFQNKPPGNSSALEDLDSHLLGPSTTSNITFHLAS